MTGPTPSPYGAWPSPVTAADAARGSRPLGQPALVGDEVWWTEGRPGEGGRQAVVRRRAGGEVEDVLPAPWDARSRVHEYGGSAWTVAGSPQAPVLVFVHFPDQRVYALAPGEPAPRPLTPPPPAPAALRHVDPLVVGARVWWVREAHGPGGRVTRRLVAVPLDGSGAHDPAAVREVLGGSDFLASAAVSPDGTRVAWVAWDHPRMPWDGSEVRVAELGADGRAGPARTVLGGPAEAVLQPEWADADTLYAVSDRSGWWNLYRVAADGSGAPEPLCPREEEFGVALWTPGYRTYAPLGDGRLAVLHGRGDLRLGVLDPATGSLADPELPWASWAPLLHAAGTRVAGVGLSPAEPDAVVLVDLADGARERVRAGVDELPDPAYLPVARRETLAGGPRNGGREVHAVLYPPRNPAATGPRGEAPPWIVSVHGGPTAHAVARLSLPVAYFTSRGVGVIEVNYGGSTGYGRAYRERLRGRWGVVDVEDCVAAALALADRGEADPARLVIKGASAGGWTTLAAVTGTDVFAAGTSYFGVAELLRFAADTHDFESRYLDGLVGRLPEDRERYVARAPLTHVEDLACPVLLLQGLDDEVVPPSQSELFRDAAARKGVPHAYLAFEGEGHGFRRVETVVACLEAELSFYGQVLGFDPPGVARLALVTR